MTNIRLSSDDRGKDNILYDKSGKEFNIVTYGKNFLGCGEYGRVFKLNDKYCVKIMNHVFDKVPKGYKNLYFCPRLLDTKMDPYALEYM